jgi:hypothetical protein
MRVVQVEGIHRHEKAMGQDDYHIFETTGLGMDVMAAVLEDLAVGESSPIIQIGDGRLSFQVTKESGASATLSANNWITVSADLPSLQGLAAHLRHMALAVPDEEYLVHTHVETWFTRPAQGLSDVVLQRLAAPQTGAST